MHLNDLSVFSQAPSFRHGLRRHGSNTVKQEENIRWSNTTRTLSCETEITYYTLVERALLY